MPTPFDPADDLAAIARSHDAADALVAAHDEPGAALYVAVPSVSGWSAAQHVHHTALTTRAMLDLAIGLATGRATPFDTDLPMNKLGAVMLESGLRKGGEAPPPMVPPDHVEAEDLRHVLAKSRRSAEVSASYIGAFGEAEGRAMHPYFGGLSATEWVRAARVHAEHHDRIIEALLAAQAA